MVTRHSRPAPPPRTKKVPPPLARPNRLPNRAIPESTIHADAMSSLSPFGRDERQHIRTPSGWIVNPRLAASQPLIPTQGIDQVIHQPIGQLLSLGDPGGRPHPQPLADRSTPMIILSHRDLDARHLPLSKRHGDE